MAENALFFLKGFPLVQTDSMDRALEFNGRDVILMQIVCLVSVIPIYLIIYRTEELCFTPILCLLSVAESPLLMPLAWMVGY